MKVLILNSGMGSRMGELTSRYPKCMTSLDSEETILSRQLIQIADAGLTEVVLTTGYFDSVLVNYCESLNLPLHITYVKNPIFQDSNYIYSIYCAREYLDDEIILMHGDLVFENEVLDQLLMQKKSCMVVSSALELPQKDFKAVIHEGRITTIGVDVFNRALAAQPLYKLCHRDWKVWLDQIIQFCENKNIKCYAENAFNEVSDICEIEPFDIRNMLCSEIDTQTDLSIVQKRLQEVKKRTVYMCFSTDILHSAHIAIIKKAKRFGKLIIGVMSDAAVASYRRFPLVPFSERKAMFENITGVYKVVEQRTISYKENLLKYRPDYVVHGDDWVLGFQRPVRDEIVSILAQYGGKLVEYPYAKEKKYKELDRRIHAELSLPDIRRSRLKNIIRMKGFVTAIEAHSGLTGLIAEKTIVYQQGKAYQFDAMWLSSLCDSTAKGKPDIEVVDLTSRFSTIDDIMEVTTKPIIFDGDTGGQTEHFIYTVKTLERMGVSMVIIEDKTGLKRNSLFGVEVEQTQETVERFCNKIASGKKAQKTQDFMICARIESLILEKGMEDALNRAFAYADAGADAIMIHSRRKEPDEVFEFVQKFRAKDDTTLLIVVPTSFHSVTEEQFKRLGVNVVIYANHLTRAGFLAMQDAAKRILENHRAKECDDICMPFEDIITLIPDNEEEREGCGETKDNLDKWKI